MSKPKNSTLKQFRRWVSQPSGETGRRTTPVGERSRTQTESRSQNRAARREKTNNEQQTIIVIGFSRHSRRTTPVGERAAVSRQAQPKNNTGG